MDIYDPEFVKRLFNQMSSSYERMNFITSFGFSIVWRRQFMNKLEGSDQNIQVLDLLSGLGENWDHLMKKYPNADFFALDFSDEMIKKSSAKSSSKLNNRFTVLQEDILNTKIPDHTFDKITCAFGLKTFNENQLNILAETISRILKDKGEFSFVEISKPKNKWLNFFYSFYLSQVIPVLGKLFLGNPNDYKMLWTYTKKFSDSQKAIEIFKKYNLQVSFESYFFGCATGIYGRKNTPL